MELPRERRVAPVARCEVCNQILTREDAVTEKVVKTSRGLYHTHHFKCFFCCCDLAGVEYTEQNKRILCINCHEDKNLPKCFGCQLTIFDEATDFSGKLYHYDCIKCFYCFNPLPNGEYYLMPNAENKKIPADEDCYMVRSSLQAHRILVALWCTIAVYFPILTILLICYELIMVLKNCPEVLDEIEWIIDWAKDLKKWLMTRPVEPEEVQKLIGMALQQREEAHNSGDWEEIESNC